MSRNAKGGKLEHFLMEQATARGVWMRHNTPPMQITGRKGRHVTCRLEGPGWLDFTATLPGGRSVDFDAKEVEGATKAHRYRWTLGSRIRGHQGDIIARLLDLGHTPFVYLRRRQGLRFEDYVVPGRMVSHKPASIPWEELEPYRLEPGRMWMEEIG